MANSIEIEIIANFKDNATDRVKELNAELDKLEKRNVSVNVSVSDRATQMTADIENRLSRVDGSKATNAIEKVTERADNIVNANNEISVTANTSAADSALTGLESRIGNINKSANVDVATPHTGDGFMLNGSWIPISGMSNGGAESDTAERIADGFTQNTTRGVSAGSYDTSAMEAIDEYASLKGQIAEYGIKLPPGADLNTMRNAVFEYEDRNFQPKSTPPEVSTNAVENAGMEQGGEVADTYLTSLGKGMRSVTSKVASRFMGARMLYKGINEAASDFQAAFESDNDLDRNRSLSRGATKGGLMAVGALVGTAIPGVGTLMGAGAGALLSTLFGDELADALSGIHKSAEELKNDRLDELFGNIGMAASDLSSVASNMLGSFQTRISSIHQSSFASGFSMQDSAFTEYGGIWELGSKLQLKNNLLIKNTDTDLKAYQNQVSTYMDDIKDTIAQEMYNSFMNNDDLFGYGNWDTSALSKKYSELFNDVTKESDDLSKYLKKALRDGQLSTDEVDHINGVVHTTQAKTQNELPQEDVTKADTFQFLAKSGMLSRSSYEEVMNGMQTGFSEDIYNLAEKRTRAIANGMSESEADAAFWKQSGATMNKYAQSVLDSAHNMFGEDYNTALSAAWNNGSSWHGTREGLNAIYDENSNYSNYVQGALAQAKLYAETGTMQSLGSTGMNLSDAKNQIVSAFDNVNSVQQAIFGDIFAQQQPIRDQIMQQAKFAAQQGQDISGYIDPLMGMYQIGALGGNQSAKEQYAAMLMAGDSKVVEAINAAGGIDQFADSNNLGKDFADMWKLMTGSNNSNAEAVKNQSEEAKKALDDSAQKIADAAADGTEKQKAALEESGEKTAEAATDGTDKIVDAVTDNAGKVEDATKNTADKANELGENILDAVGESLDKIDADMLSDSNIGEKLMSAIGGSLDNMDADMLGESNIGETLMNSITESLSADNMDFSELSIGQSILEGISASFEGVEFGELDIGTKIMEGISASFEGIEFGELDVGSRIMEGISASLEGVEFGELDIGSKIMNSINASMESVDMSSISERISSQLSSIEIEIPTIEIPEIEIPEIEIPEVDVPDIEGTVNYMSNFDGISDPPELNGIVKYSADFSGIGSPPELTGTVTYTASFSGLHAASGTPYAPEGLAMVNDDGTSDPRELIEHNGQLMMYEGRDVMVPLSQGDRVFTSAQTKDILSGRGIPHFAEGINNDVIATNREAIDSGSNGSSISIDGVSINITIEGNSNGNVVEEIRQRSGEIAEIVTAEIQRHLSASFANSTGGDD